MRLTFCYLGVLVVLCVIPITLTVFALFSKQWIIYTTEISQTQGSNPTPMIKSTVFVGLYKTLTCTDAHTPQLDLTDTCIGMDNRAWIAAQITVMNATLVRMDGGPELVAEYTDFLHKINKKLKTIKAVTILGLILEVVGALLAMSFWRRSLEFLSTTRWLVCALCWWVSGVALLATTGLGFPLNDKEKVQLDHNAKWSNEQTAAQHVEITDISTKTAWALLVSGLAFFHAFVTGAFVLMARCFRLPSNKYSPISLITYSKGRGRAVQQDGEMLLQEAGEAEEGDIKLNVQNEYHD